MIYAFNNGEISEYGNHEELMNKKGVYYNLLKEQSINCSSEKQVAKGTSSKRLHHCEFWLSLISLP